MNIAAFEWGRRAAHDPGCGGARGGRCAGAGDEPTLEEIVARRVAFLTDYQNAAYAERYRARVERIAAAEAARRAGRDGARDAKSRIRSSS